MRRKLTVSKALLVLGMFLLVAVPGTAFAHDNLGGDDLAVANWMFVGAMITIVLGLLWGLWAWRNGQFHNVEESKYRMLELDDDFDRIMQGTEMPDAPEEQLAGQRLNAQPRRAGRTRAH